ncbi:MAG: hypothetical protein IJ492_01185 [Clostridia bacterium]|nr:hypothetical protein [Clostridia bacterium]
MIKKLMSLIALLCVIVILLIGCVPKHECQSVCQDCGFCTNEAFQEDVCVDKCQGHIPPHSCQSICTYCGKCRNTDCLEEICADKCSCHYCENVCDLCGKCTNQQCAELACEYKCDCVICVMCGRLYIAGDNALCPICEHLCFVCGKCTDINCQEEYCQGREKCFTCHTTCARCGKCWLSKCKQPGCEEKCTCEQPLTHFCNHVCTVCGVCTSDCTDYHCTNKCDGVHGQEELNSAKNNLLAVTYQYSKLPVSAEQEKKFCKMFEEYIAADYENRYDGGDGDIVLYSYYGKIDNLDYLCVGYQWPNIFGTYHYFTIEGIQLCVEPNAYVFVSDGTQLIRIDHAYEQNLITFDNYKQALARMIGECYANYCEKNSIDLPDTFQVNVIGLTYNERILFYIGQHLSEYEQLTPQTFVVDNINYDKVTMNVFCQETQIYQLTDGGSVDIPYIIGQVYLHLDDLIFRAYVDEYCK